MPTKPGGQTIAFTSIRVIAADGEIGRTSFERCFPALAQIPLRTVEPGLANQPLGLRAIRLVLMLHYPLTHLGRCFAGRFGMETRMTDGSIQRSTSKRLTVEATSGAANAAASALPMTSATGS